MDLGDKICYMVKFSKICAEEREYSSFNSNYHKEIVVNPNRYRGEDFLNLDKSANELNYWSKVFEDKRQFFSDSFKRGVPFSDSEDIWEGFNSDRPVNFRERREFDYYTDSVLNWNEHMQNLDAYVEKWNMYKGIFDEVKKSNNSPNELGGFFKKIFRNLF